MMARRRLAAWCSGDTRELGLHRGSKGRDGGREGKTAREKGEGGDCGEREKVGEGEREGEGTGGGEKGR